MISIKDFVESLSFIQLIIKFDWNNIHDPIASCIYPCPLDEAEEDYQPETVQWLFWLVDLTENYFSDFGKFDQKFRQFRNEYKLRYSFCTILRAGDFERFRQLLKFYQQKIPETVKEMDKIRFHQDVMANSRIITLKEWYDHHSDPSAYPWMDGVIDVEHSWVQGCLEVINEFFPQ